MRNVKAVTLAAATIAALVGPGAAFASSPVEAAGTITVTAEAGEMNIMSLAHVPNQVVAGVSMPAVRIHDVATTASTSSLPDIVWDTLPVPGCHQTTEDDYVCRSIAISRVVVNLGDQADWFSVPNLGEETALVPVQVDGGSGGDVISGSTLADTLTDGPGNDELRGMEGADVLTSGEGDDTIRGGAGSDQVDSGAGADAIWVSDSEQDTVTCGTESDWVRSYDVIDVFASDCDNFM